MDCSHEITNGAFRISMQGEDYGKRFKVYLEVCPQVEHCFKTLSLHLPSAMERLSINKDVCKVLSIGSGHGVMDLQAVIKVLKELSKNGVYTKVVEPNEYFLDEYKASVKQQLASKPILGRVVFDIDKPKSFGDYVAEKKANDSVKFDVVHFIHSIYHIDFEEALTHCYRNELGDKGLIICVIGMYT